MNITIDTTLKTITINGRVNGKEFMNEIKKLGIDLKEYSIETKVEIVPYYPYQPVPIFQTPYPSFEGTFCIQEGDIVTFTNN